MNYIQKLYIVFMTFVVSWMMMGIMTGCSDKDEVPQDQYGYVQFKLYKSASYNEVAQPRAVDKLTLLNDAKKIEVI